MERLGADAAEPFSDSLGPELAAAVAADIISSGDSRFPDIANLF